MQYNLLNEFKKFKSAKYSAAYVAKIAILTAISFLLYAFGKFNIPVLFPSFLEIQISELPALLAGFSMGPVSGCFVIIFKCLLKLPLSTTQFVGEITDIVLGISLVLPASVIYMIRKNKKYAIAGLFFGSLIYCSCCILMNRYVTVPFYVEVYFDGNFDVLVQLVKPLYKNVTLKSFYFYYLLLGVLPFNLLRSIIVSVLTFLLYKKLSKLLHWEGHMIVSSKLSGEYKSSSIEETYSIAEKIEETLEGGEIILLEGDLGAGKTTFTKGLAKALGVNEEVTSPTFTILNVYDSGRLRLNHLDMYRIESEDELFELGIEDDVLNDGITVIEWNKFKNLNGRIIKIKIDSIDENNRIFHIDDSKEKINKQG